MVSFSQNGKQSPRAGSASAARQKIDGHFHDFDNSGSVPRIAEIDFEGQQTAVGFSSPAATAGAGE